MRPHEAGAGIRTGDAGARAGAGKETITVTPASLGDVDLLQGLSDQCPSRTRLAPNELRLLVGTSGKVVLVARHQQRAIGFISVEDCGGTMVVSNLSLHPDADHESGPRALLAKALEQAETRGPSKKLFVHVTTLSRETDAWLTGTYGLLHVGTTFGIDSEGVQALGAPKGFAVEFWTPTPEAVEGLRRETAGGLHAALERTIQAGTRLCDGTYAVVASTCPVGGSPGARRGFCTVERYDETLRIVEIAVPDTRDAQKVLTALIKSLGTLVTPACCNRIEIDLSHPSPLGVHLLAKGFAASDNSFTRRMASPSTALNGLSAPSPGTARTQAIVRRAGIADANEIARLRQELSEEAPSVKPAGGASPSSNGSPAAHRQSQLNPGTLDFAFGALPKTFGTYRLFVDKPSALVTADVILPPELSPTVAASVVDSIRLQGFFFGLPLATIVLNADRPDDVLSAECTARGFISMGSRLVIPPDKIIGAAGSTRTWQVVPADQFGTAAELDSKAAMHFGGTAWPVGKYKEFATTPGAVLVKLRATDTEFAVAAGVITAEGVHFPRIVPHATFLSSDAYDELVLAVHEWWCAETRKVAQPCFSFDLPWPDPGLSAALMRRGAVSRSRFVLTAAAPIV